MKYILKNIGTGLVVGLVIMLILMGLEVAAGRSLNFNESLRNETFLYLLYGVVLTMVNSNFFHYLNTKVVWNKYKQYRLIIGAAGSVVLTMISIFFLRMFSEMYFGGETWNQFIASERLVYYLFSLLLTLIATVIFHAIYFYKSWQENKVKEQQIIAGTASAKFDALKNQLDPHFLFNSLNVLTSLIEEDPNQAQKFTTSLSKVYRYVLEQKNKDLVTVDEELQFAKTYIRLLKMRFEESIIFEVPEHSSEPQARIVPLSLQLLLENAVKHNVVSPQKPLKIRVFEHEGALVVENNLQEKEVVKKSSGVGLRNIQQRYAILTAREVKIHKNEEAFQVALPMLTKQISIMEVQETYIDDKRYQNAKKQVEEIKGFYWNLISYCMVIPLLALLNYFTTSFPWVIFPALGWGFGVLVHGLGAYGYNPIFGSAWEERKMRELMENDKF